MQNQFQMIIRKRSHIGKWIESYLSGRRQIVKINDSQSKPIDVTSGTGQGYPIGATLFIMFVIDLPFVVKDPCILSYADDKKLSKCIKSYSDCDTLQKTLNLVVRYFERNQLKLNVSKTKMISYHHSLKYIYEYKIGNEIIEKVNVIKDLGVLLDEKLNYKSHIECVVAKAKSRLAWIEIFGSEFDDPWTIKRLYDTIVLPIIEYASQIWNPHYKNTCTRIESIQKQFLLYALRRMKWNSFKLPKYEHRLLFFQMITLEERRKMAQISFIFNIINGDLTSKYILSCLEYYEPQHDTRLPPLFKIPKRKNDYTQYEPINYMLTTFNDFYCKTAKNSDIKLIDLNVNLNTAKKRIENYLKQNRE